MVSDHSRGAGVRQEGSAPGRPSAIPGEHTRPGICSVSGTFQELNKSHPEGLVSKPEQIIHPVWPASRERLRAHPVTSIVFTRQRSATATKPNIPGLRVPRADQKDPDSSSDFGATMWALQRKVEFRKLGRSSAGSWRVESEDRRNRAFDTDEFWREHFEVHLHGSLEVSEGSKPDNLRPASVDGKYRDRDRLCP